MRKSEEFRQVMDMDRNRLYRMIPKVDVLLQEEAISALVKKYGSRAVTEAIRSETEHIRAMIRDLEDGPEAEEKTEEAVSLLEERITKQVVRLFCPGYKRVINGTGTILHTNLGRAPLGEEKAASLAGLMAGYSNLEYDLTSGERTDRSAHFEELVCRISGAEAALAVNNNAAAVFLILHTLARGGEVIVSRGELVEIGGKFRIPEVLEAGGTRLREVGTTNKTRLSDYENAITEDTRAILKVHTSNYQIVGFTESVPAEKLRETASAHRVLLIEDLGSGVLADLTKYGLPHEPTVQEAVRAGADLVCFSGDKLLGGPQAGLILGRREYIEKMKKNPLSRALRVDKFTTAALELVLMEYLNEDEAITRIPVLKMLCESREKATERAEALKEQLCRRINGAVVTVEETISRVGGGAMPGASLQSAAVVIRPKSISADALENRLRLSRVPVIGRVAENAVWLDVRTIDTNDFPVLVEMVKEALGQADPDREES